MKKVRAVIRALCIGFILSCLYVFFFLNKFLTPYRSKGKRRSSILQGGCRLLAKVLGLKIRIVGMPPQPPFILVANHLSYVDIVLLATQLKCVFISKAEVRQWPFLGGICALADTIFIDRKDRREISRVNHLIENAYKSGDGVVFFPEGTSTAGAEVGEFKSPLLESAVRNHHPVYYASLHYQTPAGYPPAHESVCWWGDMEFAPHFKTLLQISNIQASVHFGTEPLAAENREELARRLRQSVVQQFVPTYLSNH